MSYRGDIIKEFQQALQGGCGKVREWLTEAVREIRFDTAPGEEAAD